MIALNDEIGGFGEPMIHKYSASFSRHARDRFSQELGTITASLMDLHVKLARPIADGN